MIFEYYKSYFNFLYLVLWIIAFRFGNVILYGCRIKKTIRLFFNLIENLIKKYTIWCKNYEILYFSISKFESTVDTFFTTQIDPYI
jgi:hypothetical protein